MSIQEDHRRRLRSPRDISRENRLLLFAYPGTEIFKIREGIYRQLGFEGANDLKTSTEWEKNEDDRERVTRAFIASQQLPPDQLQNLRKDSLLWERALQNRTRIVFALTMSFINKALRTGHFDKTFFYETIEGLSGRDEKLKPKFRAEIQPESEEELAEKVRAAQKLSDEDPTQIIFWEDIGLKILPNDIFDYIAPLVPSIRYGALLDYEERLRKKGMIRVGGKYDWRRAIESNVQNTRFLFHQKREDKRTVIKLETGNSVPYISSDPKDAFVAKTYEASIYDKNFSYTRAMAYWDKEFARVVKEKSEKLEEAKVSYESSWGWKISSKRIKNAKFDEEKARALLDEENPSKSSLLEQASIALYGKTDADTFDKEREILGLRLLEKGHIIFMELVFSRASRIENERARDLQKARRNQGKKDEFKPQREALSHNQGKEQLVAEYYTKMVNRWISEFLDVVGFNNALYREYGDLHDKNLKEWGVYEKLYARKRGKATRLTISKMTVAEYRNKLENADKLSLGELYRLAINALRNPFKGKEQTSELVGFELLVKCFEMATTNLDSQLNKDFFARVLIEEYTRKWIKNKPKGQTEPKIRGIIFRMMQSIQAMKPKGESQLPIPQVKP